MLECWKERYRKVEEGRSEHLQWLRLKRPKDEMKFRSCDCKCSDCHQIARIPVTAGAQPIPTTSCSFLHTVDRKLTISEMQSLTAEEKHVYTSETPVCHVLMHACDHGCVLLIRWSKVCNTITKECPGNEIPGANSKKNSDQLDQLVHQIAHCIYN